MSRNEEKAKGMLNRWTAFKAQLSVGEAGKATRVGRVEDVKTLGEAMTRRRTLVKELSDKIAQIQNAALGEQRIRELNDEINKMLRIKFMLDRQVAKLGGPGLERGASKAAHTYKYFGAARDLPQVKEWLGQAEMQASGEHPGDKNSGSGTPANSHRSSSAKRSREDIAKAITYSYFATIDDSVAQASGLLQAERAEEARLRSLRVSSLSPGSPQPSSSPPPPMSDFEQLLVKTLNYSRLAFLSDAQLAELDTTAAMEGLLVKRKREQLAAKYL